MSEWHLRITQPESITKEDFTKFITKELVPYLQKRSPGHSVAIGYETGDKTEKPHVHIYIDFKGKPIPETTLRDFLNRHNLKGNQCYSLSQQYKDTIENLSYCTSGELIHKENIPDDVWAQAQERIKVFKETQSLSASSKLDYYVKLHKLDVSTKYKCMVAVMKYYLSFQKVPQSKFMLEYFSNCLYVRMNKIKPDDAEDMLNLMYGIFQDPHNPKKTQTFKPDYTMDLLNCTPDLPESPLPEFDIEFLDEE